MILGNGSFVEDEGQREGAAEVEGDEVDVPGVLFEEGFFGEIEVEQLGLDGLYPIDLLEDRRVLEFESDVLLVRVIGSRTGPHVEFEQILQFLKGKLLTSISLEFFREGKIILCSIQKVQEEITVIQEEIAFEGSQHLLQFALSEDQLLQLGIGPLIGLLDRLSEPDSGSLLAN